MHRRDFIKGISACAALGTGNVALAGAEPSPFKLPRVEASISRLIATTVCTRPFRLQGARIEAERLGRRKTLIHNYGHGGSGWSLSWGSSTLALRLAQQTRADEIAVIGSGALGLTSALLAQRAGLKVRIYARERPPEVLSTLATGGWTPNSRYISAEHLTPEGAARWEEMARISFRMYQHMLGLPGDPVEWYDGYYLRDPSVPARYPQNEPAYPRLGQRIRDINPESTLLEPGTHPFHTPIVRRYSNMMFNLSAYQRMLMSDFLMAGGVFETREFDDVSDIAKLRERTIINATGYGARALLGDETIVPVRGQLQRFVPQKEVTYGLDYQNWSMLPRRDGIVLQLQMEGDFGSADVTPSRTEAEQAVAVLAEINSKMTV